MRQGQSKRIRGRSRGGGNNSGGGGGKGPNPLSRSYESNGPDVKIRGTAGTIADKYVQLSRDALTSGDPVGAENYMQHAEHYYRLLAAAQAQYQPHQTVVRADADDFNDVDFDDEGGEQGEGGQPQTGQAGAPPPLHGGQSNGQPYQARQPNPGRPNGPFGQQSRDDQPRRHDRNDRRPDNRFDRPSGGRPDNRFDAARPEGVRGDDRRPDRESRQERSQRPIGDDQPAVGGLPAFITGGAPAAGPDDALSPASPTKPPFEPQSTPASRHVDAVGADPTDETAAQAASSERGGPSPEGDPRDETGGAPPRSRRRRYGRYGRGAASEEGDGAPQPDAETSSD
jgi:hypothetical protein